MSELADFNIRPADPGPYQEVLDRLGVSGSNGAEPTPIEEALSHVPPPEGLSQYGRPEASPAVPPTVPSAAPQDPYESPLPAQPAGEQLTAAQMEQAIGILQSQGLLQPYGTEYEEEEYAPAQPAQAGETQLPTLDPYDERSAQAWAQALQENTQQRVLSSTQGTIAELIQNVLDEQLEPYKPILGMFAEQQGKALAEQLFTNIEQRVGKFDHDRAYVVSEGLKAMGLDPETALWQAAVQQHEHDKATFRAGVESVRGAAAQIQQAPSAPAGPASPASEVRPAVAPMHPQRYTIAAQDWLARTRAQAVVP